MRLLLRGVDEVRALRNGVGVDVAAGSVGCRDDSTRNVWRGRVSPGDTCGMGEGSGRPAKHRIEASAQQWLKGIERWLDDVSDIPIKK